MNDKAGAYTGALQQLSMEQDFQTAGNDDIVSSTGIK